ncbi:MORN motif [Dillenia turbinata]|uniref:MORN motif n=1 Tax=Dillenia turbinata TaxID=194707 RepID=A0AAN8Z8W6_9MAGN
MANEDFTEGKEVNQEGPSADFGENNENKREKEEEDDDESSSSDSDSDSESESDVSTETPVYTRRVDRQPQSQLDEDEEDNSLETNIRRISAILDSKRRRKREEEEDRDYVHYEDLFDFPEDPENWKEEDLKELWADAPLEMTNPGWDPDWADEEDWEVMREEVKAGSDPPIAPFYLPYRKPYPAIPDNHYDISNPKSVIEELDRIEEFLKWVSYIFPDGSSYEGTVWDDLAHGKGVYVADHGLVRYEGEWLQNNMEGHGVVEVDIPHIQPVSGSKLEAKMRAEGKIINMDFMSPEDREWLEMDIEDSLRLANGNYITPFYENETWTKVFGEKPEKGRYHYAGQWKHGRMHGCGVYEVNERTIYGRFYFGELLEESYGCDHRTSTLHAGIAEVAAAKARMFINKPDGMVGEERGPYGDPQHPYFYEEVDVWMAPGFINQFYEVPDDWKAYVEAVDEEREMWLNSFYKAPLRLPMPAELEYWWSKGSKEEEPEFILVNKDPEPDPEDPSKLIYTKDPLILHMPTGRLINFVEDEEHVLSLFWQPTLKEGEEVDLEKVQFLPLGFDEFYGREVAVKKGGILKRIADGVENAFKPVFEKLEKWAEEKKKASETKMKILEQEELSLEWAIEDMEEELKMKEKEEEKKVEIGLPDVVEEQEEEEEDEDTVAPEVVREEDDEDDEEEGEEEEEEEEEGAPSSFGSVIPEQDSIKSEEKGKKPGKSPFSSSSLSFASCSLVSVVSSQLQLSYRSWKDGRSQPANIYSCPNGPTSHPQTSTASTSVSFPLVLGRTGRLKAVRGKNEKFWFQRPRISRLRNLFGPQVCVNGKKNLVGSWSHIWLHAAPERDSDMILCLHYPIL